MSEIAGDGRTGYEYYAHGDLIGYGVPGILAVLTSAKRVDYLEKLKTTASPWELRAMNWGEEMQRAEAAFTQATQAYNNSLWEAEGR